MKRRQIILFLYIITNFVFISCKKETVPHSYLTKNVIIVVVDGARFSETWGEPDKKNIPNLASKLAKFGVLNTKFYNDGPTYTLAGHTCMTTGIYQEINNSGEELPVNPSFFQYWNKKNNSNGELSWIITSKDKLEVLANCKNADWNNKFTPLTDCGTSGLGSGYRHDSVTIKRVFSVMEEHHPKLLLVNFREPDYSGHTGNWDNYIQGIKSTDQYIYQLWEFIQNDSNYKGKTTLFVTNDHGRHLDGISNGFVSHGDGCEGCRHISLFALGPDFKQGSVIIKKRELTDLYPTIAKLLGIENEYDQGEVMLELFNQD